MYLHNFDPNRVVPRSHTRKILAKYVVDHPPVDSAGHRNYPILEEKTDAPIDAELIRAWRTYLSWKFSDMDDNDLKKYRAEIKSQYIDNYNNGKIKDIALERSLYRREAMIIDEQRRRLGLETIHNTF